MQHSPSVLHGLLPHTIRWFSDPCSASDTFSTLTYALQSPPDLLNSSAPNLLPADGRPIRGSACQMYTGTVLLNQAHALQAIARLSKLHKHGSLLMLASSVHMSALSGHLLTTARLLLSKLQQHRRQHLLASLGNLKQHPQSVKVLE